MNTQTVRLVDQSGTVVAVAHVAEEGDRYGGTIDLQGTPSDMRALFDEFEEIVNGQMFSFLDEVEDRIDALSLKAVLDSGLEAPVRDLQVYPAAGDVSFKFARVPAEVERTVPEKAPKTVER